MSATVQAAMSGVPITTTTASTTTGSEIVVAPPPSFRHHTFIVQTPSGVTAGAVQVETANDPNYSGTWAPVGGGPVTVVGGGDVLINLDGVFQFLRARISTTISGGGGPSATITYEGAKTY